LTGSNLHLDELVHIFKHTPELQHLAVSIQVRGYGEAIDIPPLHLTSLNLSYHSNSTDLLIALFRQMPALRRIKLEINLLVIGSRWEELIVTHLPQLECFQLKMEFGALPDTNREETVDKLLATFQSLFWTKEHQWFVRCDWCFCVINQTIRLSTISYPFHDYVVYKYLRSKSTLPENHPFQSSAIHVRNLHFLHDPSTATQPYICSFSHIRSLETAIRCCDALLALIPMLHQLSALNIHRFDGEDAHTHLQTVLDRATRLRRLTFPGSEQFNMKLVETKSRTIRELIIFEKSPINWCLNREECITLAASSLGQQCQCLNVGVEVLDCVAELVNGMPNLRSLNLSCSKNADTTQVVGLDGAGLNDWMRNHFPNISWHTRRPHDNFFVSGWIR
jgi:hypothetical protein